jgi:hypothetical protein
MRPIYITETLAAAADNNIAASQAVAGAGNLVLNGSAATAGVATLDTQRRVIVTSAGNDSGITFTIYGTNSAGEQINQTITGANTGIATSTLDYLTVTRVAASGAVATTVKVGTNGVGATPWIRIDYHIKPTNVSLAATVTGTINYTAQYTYDSMSADPSIPKSTFNDPDMTALTATGDSTFNDPVTAVRFLVNSGTGSLALVVIQSGIVG